MCFVWLNGVVCWRSVTLCLVVCVCVCMPASERVNYVFFSGVSECWSTSVHACCLFTNATKVNGLEHN